MKKICLFLVLVFAVTTIFGACSAPEQKQTTQTTQSTAQSSAEKKPVVLMMGYENNPGEPVDLAANKWKQLVEEKGDGSIRIELYPSSQLGSKNEVIDQMIAGDPVATLCDGSFYADRGVPDFGIALGPYMFSNWDECWNLIESDWWQEQIDKLAENGIQIMTSNWIYGTRHTLTKMPIKSVADIKGKKIRVANSTIYVKMYEAIGAVPTPMALGDVYVALQQGTIDGLENPLSTLYNGKFHEVAKYLLLDGHVLNSTTWICGTKFWNSLTDAQRELLKSTGDEAGLFNNEIVNKIDKEMLEKFIAEGVTVTELDDAGKEEFRKASESFYSDPAVTEKWSPNLFETVKEAMKKGR